MMSDYNKQARELNKEGEGWPLGREGTPPEECLDALREEVADCEWNLVVRRYSDDQWCLYQSSMGHLVAVTDGPWMVHLNP